MMRITFVINIIIIIIFTNIFSNLPRSIMIALPLVMVIYLLANISYMTVLSKDALLASPAVAVVSTRKITWKQ